MSVLISPTEPQQLRQQLDDIGSTSSEPERHGCDFLVLAGKHRIGIQRKQFPNDLLNSLDDGRLYQQLQMMGGLKQVLLVLEGYGEWTSDGVLLGDSWSRLTLHQLHGLFFTLMFEFGVPVLWVRGLTETADLIRSLEKWVKKGKHTSLKRRPGPTRNSWGKVGDQGFGLHVLQSFPGIGPDMAKKMLDANGGMVPMTWTMTYEEMLAIDGIGKKTAERLQEAL